MKASMKQFVVYLEGVQTYWKKEREIVDGLRKEWKERIELGDLRWLPRRDSIPEIVRSRIWDWNALISRTIRKAFDVPYARHYRSSCTKIMDESVHAVYDEAFRFPDVMLSEWSTDVPKMLQEGRDYDLPYPIFATGPFGANNIYVQMDRDLFECLQDLYGKCSASYHRLMLAHFGPYVYFSRDFQVGNEEDRFIKIVEEINKSGDMHEGMNERFECNKFYDVVDVFYRQGYIPSSEGRFFVVFNGLESLLGFLVCQDPNGRNWNDLERSMAYRAACGRAGIPKGKEKEFLPDGSDILTTIKAMEE